MAGALCCFSLGRLARVALPAILVSAGALAQDVADAPRADLPRADLRLADLPRADTSRCAAPIFPRSALRDHAGGTTVVAFARGSDGKATRITMLRSSGHAGLDRAAYDMVARCYFPVSGAANEAAPAWQQVHVTWSPAAGEARGG